MPFPYLPLMNPADPARQRVPVASALHAFSPLSQPLAMSSIALLTSSAVRLGTQPAFASRDDITYRRIPFDVPATDLVIDHRSPVGTDAKIDLEVVVPRAALNGLSAEHVIGKPATAWFSFSGGIPASPAVEDELAASLAGELRELGVDLALLAPY